RMLRDAGDQDAVSATAFEAAAQRDHLVSHCVPVVGLVPLDDLFEVGAVQQQTRRVSAAQALCHLFVDQSIVDSGAFPGHAADYPDCSGRRALVGLAHVNLRCSGICQAGLITAAGDCAGVGMVATSTAATTATAPIVRISGT